jgi:glycosyltransferase involved in cell wall biosynthesis
MPKVSVIVPAYNAAGFIGETLDSVLNQTFEDFEIVVVDDGSTDETLGVVKSYGRRVRWAVQNHGGQARAINRGIQIAQGEYFAYLDADDLFRPRKLDVQTRYLDEHSQIDVVYTDQYYTTPKGGTVLVKSQPIDGFRLLQYCYISRITVMHRRACLDRVGPFNEQVTGSDDWDMWVRMSECCRMAYIDEALSEYRIHGRNTSFIRPRALDHYRRTRLIIRNNACERRGYPFWLRMMAWNARSQVCLGKLPLVGERFPRLWAALDRVQSSMERIVLRRSAMKTQSRLDRGIDAS